MTLVRNLYVKLLLSLVQVQMELIIADSKLLEQIYPRLSQRHSRGQSNIEIMMTNVVCFGACLGRYGIDSCITARCVVFLFLLLNLEV